MRASERLQYLRDVCLSCTQEIALRVCERLQKMPHGYMPHSYEDSDSRAVFLARLYRVLTGELKIYFCHVKVGMAK